MEQFLDDRRVAEWNRANDIRDHLGKVQIEDPAPENAETGGSGSPHPFIREPFNRL
jgi:hypothetical protein